MFWFSARSTSKTTDTGILTRETTWQFTTTGELSSAGSVGWEG
jgi:hypothetical protein